MPLERVVLLALLIGSSLTLGGVVWYAHVAQCRLPRERWWKWIALGFALGIIRAWIGFFISMNLVPRDPWEIVSGATLLTIGVILFFSVRAAARQALQNRMRLDLLDRTDLHKLEAQVGGSGE